MNLFEVFQGDLTDIRVVRPKVLSAGELIDANWACTVAVLDGTGATVIAARAVTDKGTKSIKGLDGTYSDEECFLCYLTPTETATLTADSDSYHSWIVEVNNATITPTFNFEEKANLLVKTQGIV